jgi:hypothetical protein
MMQISWSRNFRLSGVVLLLFGAVAVRTSAAEPDKSPEPGFTPKLTAPIGIDYELPIAPRPGEALEFTLSITAETAMTQAIVILASEDALSVITPAADVPIDLGTLDAGKAAEIAVTVIPLTPGRHYLNVSVGGLIRGQQQARTIVVPVRVDDETLRKSEDAVTGNKTESVRSFRAEETVR